MKNTRNTRRVGEEYETIAANYLSENGYDILDRNFYMRGGELDIIAKKDDTVVFVEVRFRSDEFGGQRTALESVDRRKQRRICKTATFYIQKKGLDGYGSYRFDVISVERSGKIRHIQNAFYYQV